MTPTILALDLGTTGVKATLFNGNGDILQAATAGYQTHRAVPGYAEQDAEDWWSAVCTAARQVTDGAGVTAVGLCGMMNGCLLVDSCGNPLRPALIHADVRSRVQSERISTNVGADRACEIAGNRPEPFFTASKLAWLCEHEPETVAAARWCVQAKDFVAGRLCGVHGQTDFSDASLTGLFDMGRRRWSEELIDAAGVPARLLPEVVPSVSVVGHVTYAAAEATSIPAGTPVVIGAGDGACATLGAGATNPGVVYNYVGGTSWIGAVQDAYAPDPSGRLSVLCGAPTGQYVLYGTVQTASAAVDWFLREIGVGDTVPDETPRQVLERLVESSPAGAHGLLFLPYLQGERAPIWDAKARGVYFGLSEAHVRADLARAVFEGVALALGSILAAFADRGVTPKEVRTLGGGMRSGAWQQILAGVYGVPLRPLRRLREATSSGAAMIAGVGAGIYADFASAAPLFAPLDRAVAPDPTNVETYARLAPIFNALYPSMASHFADLAALQ